MSPAAPPEASRQQPRQLLTLPNLMSLSRIPLGGLFWFVLARGSSSPVVPLVVLAVAAATDVLDGAVARRRHGVNPPGVGAWLDPICDKLFVGAVLVALYAQRRAPLSTLALIVTRELLQLPMALLYRTSVTLRRWLHYDFRASWLGKAATVAQFLAVSALVLAHPMATALAEVAFALGLLALADYIRRAVAIGRRHHIEEGKG
jgi:phosphatidylglycerophosphate synthase